MVRVQEVKPAPARRTTKTRSTLSKTTTRAATTTRRTATTSRSRSTTSARTTKAAKTTTKKRTGGDDLRKRGPRDRARINVHESWEVDYWTKALGVTPAKLRQTVKKVGVMAKDVRRELGKK